MLENAGGIVPTGLLCYICREQGCRASLGFKLKVSTLCCPGAWKGDRGPCMDERVLAMREPSPLLPQVAFMHCLHLLDPDRAAQAAYRHLRPGCRLVVAWNDRQEPCCCIGAPNRFPTVQLGGMRGNCSWLGSGAAHAQMPSPGFCWPRSPAAVRGCCHPAGPVQGPALPIWAGAGRRAR